MSRKQTPPPSSLPAKRPKSKSAIAPVKDPLLAGAKAHFEASSQALRKSCAEALITGLHLVALHARCNAQGSRNDLLTTDNKGFEAACLEIGIPKRTAYRWMNACINALLRAGLVKDGEEVTEEMPTHGMPRWDQWETSLRTVADGMSLNRLLVGTTQPGTEEERYDKIVSAEEEGSDRAEVLLRKLAEGKCTLVAAIRALGSQEAYDLIRKGKSEKIRKDPVYLKFDTDAKKPVGLLPQACVTLANGFAAWETYDRDAKIAFQQYWIALKKAAPPEILAIKEV